MTIVLMVGDSTLPRKGLVGLLECQEYGIVGQRHRADALLVIAAKLVGCDTLSDVTITDVRMPPTTTNGGLQATTRIKEDHPRVVVLVLSQYVSPLHTQELPTLPAPPEAGEVGYLLKDRVAQVANFIGALRMVVGGGMVIDPGVARAMIQTSRSGPGELTPRELEVMELMVQGPSNNRVAGRLSLSGAAVVKHVSSILSKLGFEPGDENRQVRAILAFLNRPTS